MFIIFYSLLKQPQTAVMIPFLMIIVCVHVFTKKQLRTGSCYPYLIP